MSEEIKSESVATGSSDDLIKTVPASASAGETVKAAQTNEKSGDETVPKSQYEELETRLGQQGQELGEYRDFLKQVGPLLDQLDKQPDLVKAIMDGKVDATLVQAALDGKVSIKEAEQVSKAHEEVKKELGKKEYDNKSSADIEKLITDKLVGLKDELTKGFNKNISDVEHMREFENHVNDFVSKTKDFGDYADDIQKWFDEHPTQDDIEIAYNAVKGERLSKAIAEDKSKIAAKANKEVAANAAGGGSQSTTVIEDKNLIDTLISPKSNPNLF